MAKKVAKPKPKPKAPGKKTVMIPRGKACWPAETTAKKR